MRPNAVSCPESKSISVWHSANGIISSAAVETESGADALAQNFNFQPLVFRFFKFGFQFFQLCSQCVEFFGIFGIQTAVAQRGLRVADLLFQFAYFAWQNFQQALLVVTESAGFFVSLFGVSSFSAVLLFCFPFLPGFCFSVFPAGRCNCRHVRKPNRRRACK